MKDIVPFHRKLPQKNLKKRNDVFMIMISKDEKIRMLEKYPWVHIVRTMRQDSHRHHYYMAEENLPMRYLAELRGEVVPKQYSPRQKCEPART